MTTLDLDALEKLEREATDAPWCKHAPNSGLYTDADREGHDAALIRSHGLGAGYMKRDEDAAFIATLRNAAPALIARARRADELEAENAWQPIETAPHADVILVWIDDEHPVMWAVYWQDQWMCNGRQIFPVKWRKFPPGPKPAP